MGGGGEPKILVKCWPQKVWESCLTPPIFDGHITYIYIYIWANYNDQTAEVTLNGGLVRESPPSPLNSGLRVIVICPDIYIYIYHLCL